jgi:hypothetical protein
MTPRPLREMGAEERAAHYRACFQGPSRFQRQWQVDAMERGTDGFAERFRAGVIQRLEGAGIAVPGGGLEALHRKVSNEWKAYNLADGVNPLSSLLYEMGSSFIKTYHDFMVQSVSTIIGEPFYFQATPTIRVHCPHSANAHHYPRYHTDAAYGHPPEEINLWIPLTEPCAPQQHGFRRMDVAHSRAALESFGYDMDAFIRACVEEPSFNETLHANAPQVATKFGAMSLFDSRCVHTAEPLENHTRVSIDVRVIPVADYDALTVQYQGSGRRQVMYSPVEGYYALPSDRL